MRSWLGRPLWGDGATGRGRILPLDELATLLLHEWLDHRSGPVATHANPPS
ncbi:hypothetical protein [Nocardia sp. NPDC004722]